MENINTNDKSSSGNSSSGDSAVTSVHENLVDENWRNDLEKYNSDIYPYKRYTLSTKEIISIIRLSKNRLEFLERLDNHAILDTWDRDLISNHNSVNKKLVKTKPRKFRAIFKHSETDVYRYFNLEIKKSTIKNAGMGVFALEDIPKGWSAQYVGIPMEEDCCNEFYSWQIFPYNEDGLAYRNMVDEDPEVTEDPDEEEVTEDDEDPVLSDPEPDAETEDAKDAGSEAESTGAESAGVENIDTEISEDEGSDEDSDTGTSISSEESISGSLSSSSSFDPTEALFVIDSTNPSASNWTRCVNCAIPIELNNIEAVQQADNIFYYTIKDIKSGEELFVDYGENYRVTHLGGEPDTIQDPKGSKK